MKEYSIKLEENTHVLSSKASPNLARSILLLIATIAILIPLVVTAFIVIWEIGFQPGVIISYVICWGIGAYLVRVWLWNTYGKEIISYGEDTVKYVADYKYFRDGLHEFPTDNIKVEIIEKDGGRIVKIFNNEMSVLTVTPIPFKEAQLIWKEIETRYNTR